MCSAQIPETPLNDLVEVFSPGRAPPSDPAPKPSGHQQSILRLPGNDFQETLCFPVAVQIYIDANL